MLIDSITLIYFSPTGTTKEIINSIIKGMGIVNNEIIDLTLPKVTDAGVPLIDGDIVLIGVPVYATGIPNILNSFFTSLKVNNKPVVLIAVYGNMSEETPIAKGRPNNEDLNKAKEFGRNIRCMENVLKYKFQFTYFVLNF